MLFIFSYSPFQVCYLLFGVVNHQFLFIKNYFVIVEMDEHKESGVEKFEKFIETLDIIKVELCSLSQKLIRV